ncbi:MAG TPA: FHA domain-containing protein [Kofleriaceae bacterium]|nr:FHA domain-containing protein [Kofleriaceae bacterium]
MDASAHYRHLIALGRDEFLAAAAPAALVRYRTEVRPPPITEGGDTMTLDEGDQVDETLPRSKFSLDDIGVDMELFPLVKKPGASFPDRITIGRTSNNDLVISDHSVSRLHAYLRQHAGQWLVADAGSKNGSWLRGEPLEARREKPLPSRAVLRLGDVDLTFYLAADLYAVLGGEA